jgi:hypothetical protein
VKPAWQAWKIRRGCTDKRVYKHEGQARREAHKRNFREYKCKYCGFWHLTSKK